MAGTRDNDYDMVDHSNPYAVDAGDLTEPPGHERSHARVSNDFYVDGKQIECGAELVLPSICIRTGETEDLVEVTKTLSYSSPIMFIIGGAILAAVTAKKCTVTYFLSQETSRRNRNAVIVGVVSVVLGIAVIFGGIAAEVELAVLPGVVLLLGGLIVMGLMQTGLKATKHKGGRFWLSGFKPNFFDELADMYDA